MRPAHKALRLAAVLITTTPTVALAQPDDEVPVEDSGEEVVPVEDEGEVIAPSDDPPPEKTDDDAGFGDMSLFGDEGDESGESSDTPPDAPPAKGRGVIWGTVKDDKFKEPLYDAQITIRETKQVVRADLNGNFRVELPPGVYSIRVWYDLHQAQLVGQIRVTAGGVQRVDFTLVPDEDAVDTIVVEERADTSDVAGLLLTRKRAAAVGDAIGRAEISKQGDSNAAEASKRVVGANIVDGRFVYVRGLGERYTNSLLDGAILPSPEPDRQTVPLDLFPTLMLDSVTIVKTFTPDVPGDFAGGSVRINTRRLPDEFLFAATIKGGFRTDTTFRDRLSYPGGSLDWLAIDDGTRALPDSVGDYRVARGLQRPDGSFIDSNELNGVGRDLVDGMSTKRSFTPVDHGGDVVIGNSWDVGKKSRLGAMAALTYSRSFRIIDDGVVRTYGLDPDDESPRLLNDLSWESGQDSVRWGALGGLTYEVNEDHRFHFTGIYTRLSTDTANEIEGEHEERGATIHETRLTFISRALLFGQLRGEHEIDELNNATIEWNASLSQARRDQPKTRASVWELDNAFGYRYEDDSQSGLHFYSDQKELTFSGGLDWTQPLVDDPDPWAKVKFGTLVTIRDREFSARRFRFRPAQGADPAALNCEVQEWDAACPDDLFTDDNVGPLLELEENTRANDKYTAGLDVLAGYVMLDTYLGDDFRLIGGPRLEVSEQFIESFDPFSATAEPVSGRIQAEDVLPALALIWYANDKVNLRASATRTIARPQLREIAPFAFTDYFGGFEVEGNPNLDFTRIINADLRFELFPTFSEIFAVSTFYKYFDAPIEQVVENAGARGRITYQNAESAYLFGMEVEARKSLRFIHDALEDFSVLGNLMLANSRVTLDTENSNIAALTNEERALSQQAPYTINAGIGYDNEESGTNTRISYNVTGPRIIRANTRGLDDIYEQERHFLDATFAQRIIEGLRVKFQAQNLLDATFLETIGPEERDDNIVRRWKEGARFQLSATYQY